MVSLIVSRRWPSGDVTVGKVWLFGKAASLSALPLGPVFAHKLVINSSCSKNNEVSALISGEATGKRLVRLKWHGGGGIMKDLICDMV